MIQRLAVVAALIALGCVPAQAQMHSMMHGQDADSMPSMEMAGGMMMGGMMGQGMMESGMMRMMGQGMGMMATGGPGPGALLRMRDALDLTDDQVRALESIRAELQSEMQGRMAAMMPAHKAASAALGGGPPDWGAYEDNLRAAADVLVRAHVTMARAAREARDVLTADQRDVLEDRGMEMMRDMMHDMRQNPQGA